MATCTLKVELTGLVSLVDETAQVLMDENGDTLVADGWVDVSEDIVLSGTTWMQGNSGNSITDRVDNIGSLSFSLNNSTALGV